MKISELTEGISDQLYHITGYQNLIKILCNNEFKLRPVFAKPSEQKHARRKKDLSWFK